MFTKLSVIWCRLLPVCVLGIDWKFWDLQRPAMTEWLRTVYMKGFRKGRGEGERSGPATETREPQQEYTVTTFSVSVVKQFTHDVKRLRWRFQLMASCCHYLRTYVWLTFYLSHKSYHFDYDFSIGSKEPDRISCDAIMRVVRLCIPDRGGSKKKVGTRGH